MKLILGIVVGVGLLVGGLWYLSGMDTADSSQLAVASDEWQLGPENAKLTLIEYADFECPACAAYQPVLKEIKDTFKDDLRFVYRSFPLPMHRNGVAAARAAEAAGKQGKYWEMYDILYAKQKEWGGKTAEDMHLFEPYAEEIGLDMDTFKQDRDSDSVRQAVEQSLESGQALKVRGTPTFFLNGRKIDNPANLEAFKTLLRSEMEGKK